MEINAGELLLSHFVCQRCRGVVALVWRAWVMIRVAFLCPGMCNLSYESQTSLTDNLLAKY